ncbi:hypothetical protein Hokovirus_1_79 [Hokovirus HKV1]|uniref:Uncharacterized protein n=1 Tax=Hokovirus HKV1 TaxID=1977638 RepID=A0A1V0SEQ2_9VIRU|nr:hypothetical protein Hokovirus_1_79 [Hokovirus HKV1]
MAYIINYEHCDAHTNIQSFVYLIRLLLNWKQCETSQEVKDTVNAINFAINSGDLVFYENLEGPIHRRYPRIVDFNEEIDSIKSDFSDLIVESEDSIRQIFWFKKLAIEKLIEKLYQAIDIVATRH